MKTYSIYRLGVKKHDFVIEDDDIRRSMSHDNNVSFNVESKDSLDIKIGDYIIEDGSHYTIYDPIDVEESNGVFSYPLVFRSPDYKLKFSIVKDEGATTFPYHGGIKEFVDLVILSLNEDQQEYTAGDIDEGNIIDLEFDNSSCFQALDDICEAANMEWNLIGTSINVKYRIGKDVDVVFEYGKEKGGYSVRLDKVQNTSIVTRLIGKGGTINLPKDYVSPDTPKRLNLGNEILEKNIDKYGKITGVYTNDNIYPRLINKTVLEVTIPEDIEKATSWKLKLDLPFDLSQQYADDKTPLIKFQTGDLTGSEFEIVDNSWNNTDKTLQIIVQEEEDGYRLPNTSRQPRIGDVFVLLNINMPQSYIDEAEEELRKATQEELNKRSEPQYAPSVKVSKRFLRKKGYSLEIGDSITVKVGDHSINTRILAINQSSSSDEINYELGDEILYSYEDNVNNQIEQIQVTLKQLISLEDVRRLFNILINQWRPLWFDQKLHTYDPVEFKSVTSTDFESKLKGWIIDALGNAEFRDLLIRSFKSWNFAAGPLGAGVGMVNDDELQTDKLLVRKIMYVLEMMIQRMRFQGGQMVLSPAAGFKVNSVEVFDTYYRLRCHPGDFNEFEVNDQARIQNFNGSDTKYLWSLVVAKGDDYIDISRVDKDGEGVPAEGDEIVQLGNRTNTNRQDAVLLSAVNGEVGIFTYFGINSFDLSGKEGSWFGKHGDKKGAVIKGEVHITAGSYGLDKFNEYEEVSQDIQDAQASANEADRKAQAAQDFIDNTLPGELSELRGIIDGQIESFFYNYDPTMSNYPASSWTTTEDKERHLNDTFTNTSTGASWRFLKEGDEYKWVEIADTATKEALKLAGEAKSTAASKRRAFVVEPTPPYEVGDLWTQGVSGDLMRCVKERLSGSYVSSDWEKASKYTDDTKVNNLQIGGINLADYSGGNFLNALGLYDSSYASKGSIDGKTCLIFNRNSANCRFAPVTVENGEYTFSIWVKGSEEYDAQVLHYDGANYGATTVHVTTSWERKVMTFTAKAGTDVIHFGTKNTIYIADWKYEKGNKATDWSPSIADQNRYATEQGEAAVDNLQVGSVNLISKKMMLAWNEKNKDIALWGQDSDGIYLGINQGALYTYVCGGSAHNDLFGGTIKYKGNTQYVFQVKWKLAGEQTNNNSGVSFWALYTDGTTDGMRLGSLQTSLIVESFITKKGKTVEKIFSSYGDNKYRSRVYSLALYEGNKVLTEIPVATEDLQGQSNVNLVDGGKEVTVTAPASSTHSQKALVVPKLKPNTVYHLSFNASNLVGSPDKYSAILYNYETSTQFNDTLNSTSGGIIITRNNFTEGAYRLVLYAGVAGSTNGNSVKYTEVMLVEGFTPPSSYSPSPGDVQKEIEQSSTITKDDFAKEMGYESFQDMADKATGKGGKLVVDGLLNANLIDVETLAANNAFINKLSTNILTAGSIKASMLSVAGFTFEDNNIYSGSKFGEGAGVNIVSNTSERAFKAYKDENNFVSMFYNSDNDWGVVGKVGGDELLKLGTESIISGWKIKTTGFEGGSFEYPTYSGSSGNYVISGGKGSKLFPDGGIMLIPTGTGILQPSSGLMQAGLIKAEGTNAMITGLEVIAHRTGTDGTFAQVTALKLSAQNDYSNPRYTPVALDIANGDMKINGSIKFADTWKNIEMQNYSYVVGGCGQVPASVKWSGSSNVYLEANQTVVMVNNSQHFNIFLPDARNLKPGHTVKFIPWQSSYSHGIAADSGNYNAKIKYKATLYDWILVKSTSGGRVVIVECTYVGNVNGYNTWVAGTLGQDGIEYGNN